jgi:8-oxo-dGTP diphosphatase
MVILIDATGRVLLQQRDDDVPPAGAGRWMIPAGTSEPTDTGARMTALREFEEETGIRLERLRFYGERSSEPFTGSDRYFVNQVFFADDHVDETAIQVNEGLDFRFWSPADVETLLMNPFPRALLREFFASDLYRGTVLSNQPYKEGVAVLALDHWGRILLQLRDADLPPDRHPDSWSLPGGLMEPGEAPDATGLREFEEETGQVLEDLQFYRVFRRDPALRGMLVDVLHVYYADADLDEALLEVNEGQAFRHWAPSEFDSLRIPPHSRAILDAFVASPAYRKLFH